MVIVELREPAFGSHHYSQVSGWRVEDEALHLIARNGGTVATYFRETVLRVYEQQANGGHTSPEED